MVQHKENVEMMTSKEGWPVTIVKEKHLGVLECSEAGKKIVAREKELIEQSKGWRGKFFFVEEGSVAVGTQTFESKSFVMTINLLNFDNFEKEHLELLQNLVAVKKSRIWCFDVAKTRELLKSHPRVSHKLMRHIAATEAKKWLDVSVAYTSSVTDNNEQTEETKKSKKRETEEMSVEQITQSFYNAFGITNEPILNRKNKFSFFFFIPQHFNFFTWWKKKIGEDVS